MFIVNVHQRVGQDIKIQKVVWEDLQDKVTKKEGSPGILGEDLNASIKKGRQGYADRGKRHFEEVDQQLQHYVESMKGKLISTSRVSMVNMHRGEAAKLDHIMLWMMEAQDEEGMSEWQGETEHDHVRVQFRVGEDLLGHRCRQCCGPPKGMTRLSGETIKSIRDDLNSSMSPPAGDM